MVRKVKFCAAVNRSLCLLVSTSRLPSICAAFRRSNAMVSFAGNRLLIGDRFRNVLTCMIILWIFMRSF